MSTFRAEAGPSPDRPSSGIPGWPKENVTAVVLPPISKSQMENVPPATFGQPSISHSSLAAGESVSSNIEAKNLLDAQGIDKHGVRFVDLTAGDEHAGRSTFFGLGRKSMTPSEMALDVTMEKKKKLFLDEGWFLFNPDHRVYIFWWQLTVILTYWNLFQVPFTVAFLPGDRIGAMNVLVWLVDMLFIVDMAVIFSTPAVIHGQQITDRKIIAANYLKLHFWIDLCASVPFDRIGLAIFPDNPYVRLLAFTRVLRVRRLTKLLSKMEKNIEFNYEAVVLLKLLTLVVVLCHMEACLFWYIGIMQDEGWMDVQGVVTNRNDVGHHIWYHYLVSLYWAVTTYTTVGYGDLSPTNPAEEGFGIFVMLINMALTAYVLGNITMLTTKVDQAVLEYRASVREVRKYLIRREVDPEMRENAIQQLETRQEMFDETDQALQHCAPHIRNRVLISLYHEKLAGSKLLMGTSSDFISALAEASCTEFFQPDTVILHPKERSLSLYYVLSGALVCHDEEGKKLRMIGPGGTFGELRNFCNFPQYFAVKTKSLVKVLAIPADQVHYICDQFKHDHRVACANIAAKIEGFKIHDERERVLVKEALLKVKVHIATLKTEMVTKLCYAAAAGDITSLKAILHSDLDHSINEGDYDGRRPIHVAAASGNVKMVEYLVETEGADPNVVDNFGGTPLQDAIKKGHSATAQMLVTLGGELHLQDAGCKLCNLVMGGSIETLKLYLESGVDPDCRDYDMRTPLHIAAAEGSLNMFKLLTIFGADINAKDRFGTTPVDEAKQSKNQATVMSFLDEVTTENENGERELCHNKLRGNLARRNSLSISMARLASTR